MAYCNITIPSSITYIPVDTRTNNLKVLMLPSVTTNAGRFLTFKDYYGTSSNSTFTISTIGTNTIDDYNYKYTFSNAFGSMSFLADGLNSWRVTSLYDGALTPSVPSAAFNPANLPNLTIWLDASLASSVILSGANVTAWNDRSGNGYNLSNVGAVTTTTLNTSNVINFGTSRMVTASSVFPWRTKFVQFYVAKAASGGMLISQWSNAAYISYTYSANNGLMQVNGTGFTDAVGTPTGITNAWFLWTIGYNNGTTGTPYSVNGTARTTSVVTARADSTPTAPVYFNGNGNGQFDTSQMAEFLQYNNTLTLTQSQQVEGYLAWKWGLQGNLPANHPYKNAPP